MYPQSAKKLWPVMTFVKFCGQEQDLYRSRKCANIAGTVRMHINHTKITFVLFGKVSWSNWYAEFAKLHLMWKLQWVCLHKIFLHRPIFTADSLNFHSGNITTIKNNSNDGFVIIKFPSEPWKCDSELACTTPPETKTAKRNLAIVSFIFGIFFVLLWCVNMSSLKMGPAYVFSQRFLLLYNTVVLYF